MQLLYSKQDTAAGIQGLFLYKCIKLPFAALVLFVLLARVHCSVSHGNAIYGRASSLWALLPSLLLSWLSYTVCESVIMSKISPDPTSLCCAHWPMSSPSAALGKPWNWPKNGGHMTSPDFSRVSKYTNTSRLNMPGVGLFLSSALKRSCVWAVRV